MKTLSVSSIFLSTLLLGCSSFAQQPNMPPVETVKQVDVNRYLGVWYEVASIPQSFQKQCIGNTNAEYSLDPKKGLIKVINSCDTESGKRSVAEGRAKIVDTQTNAKLKVTFVKIINWVFAFGGDYWIVDLAPDYSYAVVGDPTRNYAWILSRTAALPMDQLRSAAGALQAQGYDTCKVLTSIQTGGFSQRVPLCEVALY